MIQRRHKIGHCQGMVDSRYVQQSGDNSYAVGQRLMTTRQHVLELVDILEKLVTGLKGLVP
jgi:DNA-binding IclR family transcriptional regulator